MPPRSPIPARQRIPVARERDLTHESRQYYQRERRKNAPIVIAIMAALATVILLLIFLRSSTSCTGEQTVKVYSGDTLNVLILSEVEGAREPEVSIQEIGYLVTEAQPRLNRSLQVGETISLPKSCAGNSFGTSWDRGK